MNKRHTRGPCSHLIAYKNLSGEVRTSILGQKLSESTLALSWNGASPSTNIRIFFG